MNDWNMIQVNIGEDSHEKLGNRSNLEGEKTSQGLKIHFRVKGVFRTWFGAYDW